MAEPKTYLERSRDVTHLMIELLTLIHHEATTSEPLPGSPGVEGFSVGEEVMTRVDEFPLEDLREVLGSLAASFYAVLAMMHDDVGAWLRVSSTLGYTLPLEEIYPISTEKWEPTPWFEVETRESSAGLWAYRVWVGGHVVEHSGAAFESELTAGAAALATMWLRDAKPRGSGWTKFVPPEEMQLGG